MSEPMSETLQGTTKNETAKAPARSGMGLTPLYDLRDYELLPDDGKRYEIIAGDIYMTPAPSVVHQIISRNLQLILMLWAREGAEGGHGEVLNAPVDVELGPHDIVQPDLIFVSQARRSIITTRRIVGAPDLVVEILSGSTADRDRDIKLRAYDRVGVREYWLVDPEAKTVTVYGRVEGERLVSQRTFRGPDELTSVLLDGFVAPLPEIFDVQIG